MSINRVEISGNLTRDAEIRGQQGTVCAFGVAVSDRRKNPQTDEWEDVPNFVDCTIFGSRAEKLQPHLTKGTKVAIAGKLRYSTWEDRATGQHRSRLEVVVDDLDFMSGRPEGQGGPRRQRYASQSADPAATPTPQGQVVAPGVYQPTLAVPPQSEVYDADIPF